MPYFIKTDVELQAIVPLKSLKKISEEGLREVAIKQDTEFGFEKHFNKDKIDKSKIDINFGFGKLTVKAEDLKEALKRAREVFLG
jgi:hypothetical protein